MGTLLCAADQVKSLLLEEVDKSQLENSVKAEMRQFLNKLPTCGVGIPFELGKTEGKARKKRAPSAYNQFIGQCMKAAKIKAFGEAPAAMRSCADEWKKRKGT